MEWNLGLCCFTWDISDISPLEDVELGSLSPLEVMVLAFSLFMDNFVCCMVMENSEVQQSC